MSHVLLEYLEREEWVDANAGRCGVGGRGVDVPVYRLNFGVL